MTRAAPDSPTRPWRCLRRLAAGQGPRLALVAAATLVATASLLALPLAVRSAIDGGVAAGSRAALDRAALLLALALAVGVAALAVQVRAGARVAEDVMLRARGRRGGAGAARDRRARLPAPLAPRVRRPARAQRGRGGRPCGGCPRRRRHAGLRPGAGAPRAPRRPRARGACGGLRGDARPQHPQPGRHPVAGPGRGRGGRRGRLARDRRARHDRHRGRRGPVGGQRLRAGAAAPGLDELLAGRAALARLADVLDGPAGLPAPARLTPLPERGALELEGVGFGYAPGRPVLHDVTLAVAPGERVALVGPTGAGKSTIARMLCRLGDPDAGVARFGGVDLRSAGEEELRRRVVLVAQEGHVVPGTLADNVRIARPGASEDAVRRALAAVGALDWARDLPQGLGTEAATLGPHGRQLLSLARVALADPAAVVLDEATSALDPVTEVRLERAMRAALGDRAVLVIAHRPGTAARCDRVLVVDGGRVRDRDARTA